MGPTHHLCLGGFFQEYKAYVEALFLLCMIISHFFFFECGEKVVKSALLAMCCGVPACLPACLPSCPCVYTRNACSLLLMIPVLQVGYETTVSATLVSTLLALPLIPLLDFFVGKVD